MKQECRAVRDRFGDYLEHSLPYHERERLDGHLSMCRSCASALEASRDLIAACHRMPEEDVAPAFEAAWVARLKSALSEKTARPRARRGSIFPALRPAAVWGAAGIALLGLATFVYDRGVIQDQAGPQSGPVLSSSAYPAPVRIDLNKDLTLRIWLDARQPIEQGLFRVDLPEGIALVENGRVSPIHEFRWIGDLKEGLNLIPVPIRAVARGEWTVTAQVEKDELRRETSVAVLVNGA